MSGGLRLRGMVEALVSAHCQRPRPTTALDVAAYVLSRTGRVSLRKLHATLYFTSMQAYRMLGRPLFAEDFIKGPYGPYLRSVDAAWLRGQFLATRRQRRRVKALRLRVRRWAIQESARRGQDGLRWLGLNMPGGWSRTDGTAQDAGLVAAGRIGKPSNRQQRRRP